MAIFRQHAQSQTTKTKTSARILLWFVLFLACMGLGYPTLNRYDPRKQVSDSASYALLVTDGPSKVEGYYRYRVLEPYLVRPIRGLALGRIGTWDPIWFGFLVVNSFFVASTAYLLSIVGSRLFENYSTVLLGSTLYLLNFATPNAQLAGLVDAGEGCFLMVLVVSLFYDHWWMLPLVGVLGAITKESFVPFSITMAVAWSLASKRLHTGPSRQWLWIASMAAVEFVAVAALQSLISGRITWPWSFAAGLNSHSNYVMNFLASLVDKDSWYILIWLLPLGLLRTSLFPRPWLWAATVASLLALVLNAYHTLPGAEGGVGRYIFSVAGPLLSISAASFLSGVEPTLSAD